MRRNHYNEEQTIFQDTFRAFLKRDVLPNQEAWLADGIVSRDVWKEAGKHGFLLPWAEEEYGGAAAKEFQFEQILTEEMSYINENGFMIFLHSGVCAPYIDTFGSEEQKSKFMPGFVSGDSILAIAMTEPAAGSDVAGIRTTAVDRGDYFELNGSKTFISNGILADVVIVAAKTDPDNPHSVGMFLVERGMNGFERGRKLDKMGMKAQDTAELFFDNVKIPRENLLGDSQRGFYYMMDKLAQERILCAIGATASAQAALDVTKEYILERKAFGKHIAHFQNSRFKMAEMKTQIDLTQVFIDRCAIEHNTQQLSSEDAAAAKLFSTEMLGRVVDECVQLHGGYGYMMEYPIARMYMDARVHRIFAGTSEIMKGIIAKGMGL
ncbi:MAG: acyl-CoA dehydrogenase [Proteobacteria bacterium]|nr:acyl-CoA dehydrogenase [Pseudomonadota bacterium]